MAVPEDVETGHQLLPWQPPGRVDNARLWLPFPILQLSMGATMFSLALLRFPPSRGGNRPRFCSAGFCVPLCSVSARRPDGPRARVQDENPAYTLTNSTPTAIANRLMPCFVDDYTMHHHLGFKASWVGATFLFMFCAVRIACSFSLRSKDRQHARSRAIGFVGVRWTCCLDSLDTNAKACFRNILKNQTVRARAHLAPVGHV